MNLRIWYQAESSISVRFLLFALLVIQATQVVSDVPAIADEPVIQTGISVDQASLESDKPNDGSIRPQGPSHQSLPNTNRKLGGFEIIHFPSGKLSLCGALFKPKGDGPFPAIIYNHGSERENGLGVSYGIVGKYYAERGFVVLVPLRRGHSFLFKLQPIATSEGDYFGDRLDKESSVRDAIDSKDKGYFARVFRPFVRLWMALTSHGTDVHRRNELWLKEQDIDNKDVVAAVKWLKVQPFVKPDMMIMSGISFGGIQTVLASEKGLGIKAFIPFAPGAMSWQGCPEFHERARRALENAKAPVFLIQAENDYNLGPSEYLGKVLDEKGGLNRHKVYPPFEPENGHVSGHGGFATRGEAIWSPDVFAFMKDVLGPGLVIRETPR